MIARAPTPRSGRWALGVGPLLLAVLFQTAANAQSSALPSVPPTKELAVSIDELLSASQRLQQRIEANRNSDAELQRLLASVPSPSSQHFDEAVAKNKLLQQRLGELEQQFTEFRKRSDVGQASIAKLERQLDDARKERDQLTKKQTAALEQRDTTAAPDSKGLRQEAVLRNLQPIALKLFKNRLVPVREPFYSAKATKLKMALTGEVVDGVVISRVHDGESVANAIRSGGLLDTFLQREDPKKAYFQLLVCSDSISAFYTVSDVISKRGFAYSWDTANDEDILRRTGNQQSEQSQDRGYLPSVK